jgi:hypothetical protein
MNLLYSFGGVDFDYTRLALITYCNNDAIVVFDLKNFTNQNDYKNAINNITKQCQTSVQQTQMLSR